MADGLMVPEGFKRTRVDLLVDLTAQGRIRSVAQPVDERGRPLERVIPSVPRTSAVMPLLVSDKLSYVAGYCGTAGKWDRARQQWAAYQALLGACAASTPSADLAARLGAVREATSDPARFVDELLRHGVPLDRRGVTPGDDPVDDADQDVLAEQAQRFVDFTVEGEAFFPSIARDQPGDPDAVAWWSARVTDQTTSDRVGICQVTGQRAPLARLFPGVGELPGNGPRLVSCNFPAAGRYGASQSDGASVSTAVASKSTQALKWLAGEARDSHRWDLGDVVLLWWCTEDPPWDPLAVLKDPDPRSVRELVTSPLWSGRRRLRVGSDFHLAVLTVNSARIVVRAAHETTLGRLQDRLRGWFAGLAPVQDRAPNARLGIEHLARVACPPGRAQAGQRARVVTDLVRAAVLGDRLTTGLRDQVVRRCAVGITDRQGRRSHVTAAQAALLHAIAHSQEGNPMPGSQGELCGRLLAVLEETQRRALGTELNRGVQASYGAASTTPQLVFPRLLSRRVAHSERLRRDRTKRGSLIYLDRHMEQVMTDLADAGGFPAQLAPAAKAEFALGYWHQRHDMHTPAPATPALGGDHDPETEATDD